MFTTSEVEVCNLALDLLGGNGRIAALTDNSEPAKACNRWYLPCLGATLEENPWRFARREATLSRVATVAPLTHAYAYSLPTDCVRVRHIWTGVRDGLVRGAVIPWDLLANPTGAAPYLVTDSDAPQIVYTAAITVVPQFPETFVMALAHMLGTKVAGPLTAQPGRVAALEMGYRQWIEKAFALDQAHFDDFDQMGSFEAARMGATRIYPPIWTR